MTKVDPDIRMIVVARTRCRPSRSPRGPKNIPPKGRITKAAAISANDLSVALPTLSCGKKTVPMMVVITPALNTPKSNHSMQFPIADATTARRTVAVSGDSSDPATTCSSMGDVLPPTRGLACAKWP
jgi:hypothetical protein